MDHLPQSLEREVEPFEIPCLDTRDYGGDNFLQYPETQGYDLDDIYTAKFQPKDAQNAAAFLQRWLFFGLLSAITSFPVQSAAYVRTLEDGQRVIDTSALPTYIASWKLRCEGLTESQREDSVKNARAIFGTVYKVLDALQKQNASLPDTRIELSVVCLAETLATAACDHYQAPDLYFPKVRCVFLEDTLLADGWCPSTVEFIASHFNIPSQYFLYTMGPPEDTKSHVDCSQLACFAEKRDSTTWPLSHRHTCNGNCPPFAIPTERVSRILEDGSFPIIMIRFTNEETEDIRLCNEDFHFEIFVDSGSSVHPYVPIFQVWSDVLGNIQSGSMALCQLVWLQRLANSLCDNAQDKSVPIWIDILCVPLRPQNHHALALDTLSAVYHESNAILVLEEALQATSTRRWKAFGTMEIIYRIMTSAWFQRTVKSPGPPLQSSVFFQMKEKAIDSEDVKNIVRMNPVDNGHRIIPDILWHDIVRLYNGTNSLHRELQEDPQNSPLPSGPIHLSDRGEPTKYIYLGLDAYAQLLFQSSDDDDDDSLQLLTSTRNRAEQMVDNPAEINHDLCSLGIKAALHWDTAGTAVKESVMPVIQLVENELERNWRQAFELWNYCDYMMTSSEKQEEFVNSLSTLQLTSWRLLSSWLRGEYQFPNISESAYEIIKREFLLCNPNEGVLESHFLSVSDRTISLYHCSLADLFRVEFSPKHCTEATMAFLQDSIASTRRVAWECSVSQCIAWKYTSITYNAALDSTATSFTCPPKRYLPCPWLGRVEETDCYPHYLWDIDLRKTVTVNTLDCKPVYTCISHTWGRWRTGSSVEILGVPWLVPLNTRFDAQLLPKVLQGLRDRFVSQYIWIDLFCIPQDDPRPEMQEITRIEIAMQASIFRRSAACVAWLNYVHHWVAEKCTIAWFAMEYLRLTTKPGMIDVNDGLEAAAHGCKMPLQLTELSDERFLSIQPVNDPELNPFNADHGVFLIQPPRASLDSVGDDATAEGPWYPFQPSDWFSGVWTLQEAYLYPNLILVDKNWDILCDAGGEPLSLEIILALSSMVSNPPVTSKFFKHNNLINATPTKGNLVPTLAASRDSDDWPPAPIQLDALRNKTRLYPGTEPSRIDLLIQGNPRTCTSGRRGRAQALMSSLGVTDWFLGTEICQTDEDLVLGMYPLPFVREAALKIGAEFYLAMDDAPSSEELSSVVQGEPIGSMLPFYRFDPAEIGMRGSTRHSAKAFLDDHPSVSTWVIEQDGSVRISQAAIIAPLSYGSGLPDTIKAYLGFQHGPMYERSREVVIHEWVEEQNRTYDTYLVSLSKNMFLNRGLILQGPKTSALPLRLVKLGFYACPPNLEVVAYGTPPTQEVDWIIW